MSSAPTRRQAQHRFVGNTGARQTPMDPSMQCMCLLSTVRSCASKAAEEEEEEDDESDMKFVQAALMLAFVRTCLTACACL